MVEISQLTASSPDVLKDINALLHQLSPRLPKCSDQLLSKILSDVNSELWIVVNGETVVGMATLAVVVLPEGERAQIEDVIIDEKYRGQGLGQKLSEKLIERARARNIPKITLSSREDRVAANKLYQKLGFTQWPTNVYQMNL